MAVLISIVSLVVAVVALARERTLARRIDHLERRGVEAERQPAQAWTPPLPPPGPVPPPAHVLPPGRVVPPKPARTSATREALAERALALAGGALLLVGVVFLLALAIANGWIGPAGRTALALLTGVALVAAGARAGRGVSRRPDRDEGGAARLALGHVHGVLAGAGVATWILGVVVGVRTYEIFSPAVGIVLVVAMTAAAVVLATRWDSEDLAALGLGVGLASPMLTAAPVDGVTLALLTIVLVASLVLAVRLVYPWLLPLTAVLTGPQLGVWVDEQDASAALPLLVVAAWWAAHTAAAVAIELRSPASRLRARTASTVLLAATIGALLFTVAAQDFEDEGLARGIALVLAGLAHAVPAALLLRRTTDRVATRTGGVLVLAAAPLLAIGAQSLLGGDGVTPWFAFEAVALVYAWRMSRDVLAAIALGVIAVAAVMAALVAVPPELFTEVPEDVVSPLLATAAMAIAGAAAAALARGSAVVRPIAAFAGFTWAGWTASLLLAWAVDDGTPDLHTAAATALGLLWTAFAAGLLALPRQRWGWAPTAAGCLFALVSVAIALTAPDYEDGVLAWRLLLGVLACAAAWRFGSRSPVAAVVALAYAAVAVGVLLLVELPIPFLLAVGAAPAEWPVLIACTAALAVGAVLLEGALERAATRVLAWAAAVLAVLTLSAIVLGALTPAALRDDVYDRSIALTTDQGAQAALSLLWGLLGIAALGVLLAAPERLRPVGRALRIGAYVLLGLAAAKVVVVDTAQLEAAARVLAFMGIGVLLLGGAWLERTLARRG